jgi:hypothetical protein
MSGGKFIDYAIFAAFVFVVVFMVVSVVLVGVDSIHVQRISNDEPPGDSNSKADYNAIPDHDFTWADVLSWQDMCNVVTVEKLHPKSLGILSLWARGYISDEQFQVMFSLPNSDYLGAAECIIRNRDTPRYWKPQA